MKPDDLPAEIGDCRYCHLKLYADAPVVQWPSGEMSHVACEVDQRRQGRGHG